MAAYVWKTGAVIKTDANIAGAQFEQLEKTVGLTPKNVVNANREVGTPLHSEFEWDNDTAAEKYRETQAAKLMRSICTVSEVVTDNKAELVEIRAFFPTGDSKYESIDVIFNDYDKRTSLINEAYNEMKAFIKKYNTLKELKPVIDVINKLIKGA